jgi:anti-sigma-K factor RskA
VAESPAQAWPLEGVMRLHSQLRQPDNGANPNGSDGEGEKPYDTGGSKVARLPEPSVLAERVESLERVVGEARIQQAADRVEQTNRGWRVTVVVLAIAAAAASAFAWRVEQRASAAAAQAVAVERQTREAREAADRRIAEAREEAARQVAQARATAVRAETVSDVLAAPDLVRYNLVGGTATNRFTGQLLWSRSRGLVFSASRLPTPPQQTNYQIWLLTATDPVSAGVFTPDASGRATFATDEPPRVNRPVIGARVTAERTGGSQTPTGETILGRAPTPSADRP